MVNIAALIVVVLLDRLATLALDRHCSATMFGVFSVLCTVLSDLDGPPTAFPLNGPQCTVGVLAGTHWGAH